jgi:hypothetical protein
MACELPDQPGHCSELMATELRDFANWVVVAI